jgi:hypothetical protein
VSTQPPTRPVDDVNFKKCIKAPSRGEAALWWWLDSQRKDAFLYALPGIAVLALFAAQKFFVARHDFFVAHHFGGLVEKLRIYALFSSLVFLLVLVSVRRLEHIRETLALRVVLVVFAGLALIAIFTHPTRSQDIYWSLLMGKAFSHFHLNPYQITTSALGNDPWAYPVLAWKDLHMMYGPLWTLFIGLVATVQGLGAALYITKVIFLAIAVSSGWLFWKIVGLLGASDAKKIQMLTLLAWNPFVVQTVLIDMHNDAFIMLALLAAYYAFLKEEYPVSALFLIIGGFVKYVPWLFLPVPIVYSFIRPRKNVAWAIFDVVVLAFAGASAAYILYMPFGGLGWQVFAGLQKQLDAIGLATEYLPGTAVLLKFFPMSFSTLYKVGMGLALAVEALFIFRKKPLIAFTMPVLVVFFFACPWFQPWYALWVLPLILCYVPPVAFAFFSVFLLLTPELYSPSFMSLTFLVGLFAYACFRFVLFKPLTFTANE